jgi:hypothetical protein
MRAYGWRITDLRYAARGLGERAEGRPVLIRTKDPRYAARYYSFAVGMTKKASQSRDIKNTNKDNGLTHRHRAQSWQGAFGTYFSSFTGCTKRTGPSGLF